MAEFRRILEDNWNANVKGTPQFSLAKKAKDFQRVSKDCNSKEFKKLYDRVIVARKDLDDMQLQLDKQSS